MGPALHAVPGQPGHPAGHDRGGHLGRPRGARRLPHGARTSSRTRLDDSLLRRAAYAAQSRHHQRARRQQGAVVGGRRRRREDPLRHLRQAGDQRRRERRQAAPARRPRARGRPRVGQRTPAARSPAPAASATGWSTVPAPQGGVALIARPVAATPTTYTLDQLGLVLLVVRRRRRDHRGGRPAGAWRATACARSAGSPTPPRTSPAPSSSTRSRCEGNDEIARLAARLQRDAGGAAASRDRQRQLVADAGHELRTPLTSLRTNLDLLVQADARRRAVRRRRAPS